MLKTTSLIVLSALALGGAAFAHGDGGPGDHMKRAGMAFMKMDKNGDKVISQQEFDANFEDRFKAADANHDGKVTRKEFEKFVEAQRKRREEEMRNRMFERLDTNHDGVISAEESKANGDELFKRLDRNGDGKLDQNDRMRDRHHERMGPGDGMGPGGPAGPSD